MKKLFLSALLAASSFTAVQAQVSATVLQKINDTVYADLTLSGSGNHLVGLGYSGNGNVLNIRTYNGTGFGSLIRRHNIGSPDSYFTHLVTSGDYIYAVGAELQAIDLINPTSPVNGPEQYTGHSISGSPAVMNNLLYVKANATADEDMLYIYDLQTPMQPNLIDSALLPSGGAMKLSNNRLYYFYTDTLSGRRIRTYNLSATPPHLTLAQTFPVNNATLYDALAIDIDGNHLYAKTSDSLYHLRIISGGNLQWERRSAAAGSPVSVRASDTLVLVQSNQKIFLHQPGNSVALPVDSTDPQSFNSFQKMERIGNNFYYSSLTQMVMIRLVKTPTGIAQPTTSDDLSIYPNPARKQWSVRSKTSGTYHLLAVDGKCIARGMLKANESVAIDAASIPSGNYYFIRMDDRGKRTAVSLVKD